MVIQGDFLSWGDLEASSVVVANSDKSPHVDVWHVAVDRYPMNSIVYKVTVFQSSLQEYNISFFDAENGKYVQVC